jgi:predicted HTH domain antitoxin
MKGIATSAFVSYTMGMSATTLTVQVDLPWSVVGGTEPDLGELGDQLRLLWIIEQVRLHQVGVGKGAELAGMAPAAFMRVLGAHGVPVIDYPAADLEHELSQLGA